MPSSPLLIALASATAGTLAAVGIANAVSTPQKIPDSQNGVITACVAKKGAAVRFIDAQKGKKCGKKKRTVLFNQTGPQGAPGVQGPRANAARARVSSAATRPTSASPVVRRPPRTLWCLWIFPPETTTSPARPNCFTGSPTSAR